MKLVQIPIGKFSKIVRLTPKALKVYEKKGFLVPELVDDINGYRYYSMNQVKQGIQLSIFSWAGFSLEEMGNLMELTKNHNTDEIKNIFEKKREFIRQEQEKLKNVEGFLDSIISQKSTLFEKDEFKIKDVEPIRVVSKREKGTYSVTIGEMIGSLFRFISKEGQGLAKIAGPIIFVAHDDEYKEVDADIEIAIPIQGPLKSRDDIEVKTLDGFKMLTTIHVGTYDNLHITYQKITSYMLENNLNSLGPSREVYLVGPQVKNPSEILTEIQIPIVKM